MEILIYSFVGIVAAVMLFTLFRHSGWKGGLFQSKIQTSHGKIRHKAARKSTVEVVSLKDAKAPIGLLVGDVGLLGADLTPAKLSLGEAKELLVVLQSSIDEVDGKTPLRV